MEDNPQPFDVRSLLWRVRRHAWLMALPPIVTLCVASVYFKITPVVYESSVIVSMDDPAKVGPALQSMLNTDRNRVDGRDRVNLVNSKVRSQAFLAAAAERLGILDQAWVKVAAADATRRYPAVPASEFAIRFASAAVDRRMQITAAAGSGVRITVTSGSAEDAQRVVTAITDLLIEDSRRSTLERVMARGRFSQDQLAVYEERLRASENALQAYQESMLRDVMSRSPVTDETVNQAHGVVRSAALEMDQTRDRIEKTKAIWKRYVPGEEPPSLASRNAEDLERQLAGAEASYALALLAAAGDAGKIPEIESTISTTRLSLLVEFENQAAALPPDVPEPARAAAAGIATDRAILRTLRAKHERMSGYIAQFERGVATSPRKQLELSRLQGEVQSNRELLTALQRETQSSRLSEAFTTSAIGLNIEVLEPPQLPLRPSAPDPTRIFGSALLLGVLLSAGIVFALEKFALVIRTVEQAETELGSRVLGTVPRIEGLGLRASFVVRRWAALSILLVLVLTGIFHGVNATTTHTGPQEGNRAGAAGP